MPRARTSPGLFALLLAAAALSLPGDPGSAQGLPSIECVRAVRKARLEQELDPETAARHLEGALELADCELPALAELIRISRTGALPEARGAELRQRLFRRVADPAAPLPDGIVEYLAVLSAGREDDRLLLEALVQRLGVSPPTDGDAGRRRQIELLSVSAHLQRELGLDRDALATIDRLRAIDDSESWLWEGLNIAYRLEDWPDVARRIESMLGLPGAAGRLRPLYVRALARLGRIDEMTAQIELLAPEDVSTAGAAVAIVGDETEAAWQLSAYAGLLSDLAWTLRDTGRDAEAEALFRRILTVDPDNASARLVLLHLYSSAEERAEHRAAVDERRRRETDPHALFEEGSELLAAGDAASALDLLARAVPGLAETPTAEAAWYNLGLAAYKLERWQEAADAFARAAELNADRPESHSQRGLALVHLDRCAEAAPELERFLALRPDKHEIRYFLARCYETLGRPDDAEREWALYQSWKDSR